MWDGDCVNYGKRFLLQKLCMQAFFWRTVERGLLSSKKCRLRIVKKQHNVRIRAFDSHVTQPSVYQVPFVPRLGRLLILTEMNVIWRLVWVFTLHFRLPVRRLDVERAIVCVRNVERHATVGGAGDSVKEGRSSGYFWETKADVNLLVGRNGFEQTADSEAGPHYDTVRGLETELSCFRRL